MAFILGSTVASDKYTPAYPVALAMNSGEILPDDVPAGSALWVADKLETAFYDGEGHWYRKADTPVDAGQPVSALF